MDPEDEVEHHVEDTMTGRVRGCATEDVVERVVAAGAGR